MLNVSRAQRTAALTVIGLGLCLYVLLYSGLTKARELSLVADQPFQVALREAPGAALSDETQRPLLQPFGYLSTQPIDRGDVNNKWLMTKNMMRIEDQIFKFCRIDMENCPPAAKLFLGIVDKATTLEPRARIGEINRAVNATLRPADDQALYGAADVWATPMMSFARRAGDCEDYAIAKYVALRESGFAPSDLRLVVVEDNEAHQGHAVVAVRFEGRWLVLDNLRTIVQQDTEISRLTPLYFIDDDGVKSAVAPNVEPAPAAKTAPLEG